MNQPELDDFLADYFANLRQLKVTQESIDTLSVSLQVISVNSKAVLVKPGEVNKHIYIVIQGGFVCRYVNEKTGEANTINFYLEDLHPIMACLDSYFTQTPTSCELKAITRSAVLAVPKVIVDELREKDAAFETFHYEVVATAMREENELKTKLIAYSAKDKYDFILEEMPSVIQRVPGKYIAEFCGISQAWLSKLKRQS
ncbi:MAG: Crp/Fnr family transcriptional regulator [Bacteroidota bacterium]